MAIPTQTDLQRLRQIAEGNKEAFKALYNLYKKKVYNTAISYLQNTEDAEEVTQDVFLTIYQKAYTFQGKAKVSTWIYRLTVNKALNRIDKRNRRPQAAYPLKDNHVVQFKHPGVQLENQEKASYLFKAIDLLADRQKTAFILTYIEGMPQKEVAAIMQNTVKGVEGLLQRAKRNLRKEINKLYPEGKTN